MPRALLISPHFPPVNAADHQRLRISLPYLKEFGWSATILAVKPGAVEGAVIDRLLESTIPQDVDVTFVSALSPALTRTVGLGSLAIRALPYLWREGNRLLADSYRSGGCAFDLIYFSTTQFPVMILGPVWKRNFGVPYVVDFQDPWLDDYYKRTNTRPPGGETRHGMSRLLACSLEPRVMRDVSQVIAVSPAYVETLAERYPHLSRNQFTVLPFGVAERDFEVLCSTKIDQRVFDPDDGHQHWAYVGRAGHDMAVSLRLLFATLAELQRGEPERWNRVRLHFIGTNYAPAGSGQKTVEPIAVECGVQEWVEERTGRVPYFEALQILHQADVLLLIGSDSPAYSASKLYPYMFARKPMLAVLHSESPGVRILRECRAGEIVTFDAGSPREQRTAQMAQAFQRICTMVEERIVPEVDEHALGRYSAREMTRQQCEVWDRVVAGSVT